MKNVSTKIRLGAAIIFGLSSLVFSIKTNADDYATRQARSYISDAEYKLRQGENLRNDAEYYKRQAESYQRDANSYSRSGNSAKALEYQKKATKAMETYNSKLQESKRADRDAADYLRKAANRLSY